MCHCTIPRRRVHCTRWTQKAILDGQGLSLSPILRKSKIIKCLVRKQLTSVGPPSHRSQGRNSAVQYNKDKCISSCNSNHLKGLTDQENINTCHIHQRDISQIYPKRMFIIYLRLQVECHTHLDGGSLGSYVSVLHDVTHPLLLLSTCCSWEFMFVRKTGKINYWQQENRAQYVAARTNVLVYIARYNMEASVLRKLYLFSFSAFEHISLYLVLNTKIPLARRKRKRGEGLFC